MWAKVEEYSDRHACASPTAALEDVAAAVAFDLDAMLASVRPEEGQRGVIVAAGDRTLSLDLCDKASTLSTEVHLGSGDVAGGALVWEGAVVHLAAFDDRTTPPVRPIYRRR